MAKKIIVITGASSGIGKATALQLIKQGHIVYGAARRLAKMNDLVKAGGHAIQMDLTQENQIKLGIKEIIEKEGGVDVLINNAGYSVYGAVEDVSLADAKRQFEVNLFGLAVITKEVIPLMRDQGRGKIINISSVGGKIYTPFGAWYHASKHALEGWSDCLRLELKKLGIDVVIVQPGIIKTEFGGIMAEALFERSTGSTYEKEVINLLKAVEGAYAKPSSYSSPALVAETISKVIKTAKPKTRYVVGKMAKPLLFFRKYLSDKSFDNIILREINKMKKK